MINNLKIVAVIKHNVIPQIVGIKIDKSVHLRLPVSFLIVRHVVEHGQCIREKSIVQIAVNVVHPLSTNNCFRSTKDVKSVITPVDR